MDKFIPHRSSEQQRIIYMYMNHAITLESAIKLMEKSCWSVTDNTKQKLLRCGCEKSTAMMEAIQHFESKAEVKGKPKKLLKTIVENDLRVSEAAEKLFISLDSANKYMKILRNHFKCKTTAALVHRAMKEGFLDE